MYQGRHHLISSGADPVGGPYVLSEVDSWVRHSARRRVPSVVACEVMPWHNLAMDATLVLGKQGRLVIPAEVRAALGLAPGDRLHLHLAGHQLMLERPQDAAAELRDLGASIPRARSLVDELLAERRLAAAAE